MAALQQVLVIAQELPRWGSRRPTTYPEWVTLEVAHGGFATGRAKSAFLVEAEQLKERSEHAEVPEPRTNQSFLNEEGLQELAAMLDSGLYQIEFPENSAFLVLVHLLRQDRVQDARELMQELAPYIDEIRFYPSASATAPTFSPLKVGVINIRELKGILHSIQGACGKRGLTMSRHQDGCDFYQPIQAQALRILTDVLENGGALPSDCTEIKKEIEALATQYFIVNPIPSKVVVKVATKGVAQDPHPVSKHIRAHSTTRVLVEALCTMALGNQLSEEELKTVTDRVRTVAAKNGVVGTPRYETYRARVELSSAVSNNGAEVGMAAAKILNSEKQADQSYLEESEVTALAEKVMAAVNKSSGNNNGYSTAIRAPRQYHGTSASQLPTRVQSAFSRAVSRTIEEHIEAGVINSAEMIADVVPVLFNAAASNKIEDPVLRRLYCDLAVAFSRRRSLLLLDLQSQVRLDELPFAKPMLAGLKSGSGNSAEVVATIDTIRIATRAWLDHFPHTMTPNRFVSAIKGVIRGLRGPTNQNSYAPAPSNTGIFAAISNMLGLSRTAAVAEAPAAPTPSTPEVEMPRLLEELAADIFMGSFSSNFPLSTLQAAKALRGTIYERYYNLSAIYAKLIAEMGRVAQTTTAAGPPSQLGSILLDCATDCQPLWGADNTGRYTVANGRIIEAVMVLSTHNLYQLYSWLGLEQAAPSEGGVNNLNAARATWKYIIGVFTNPPADTYYGYRMVAYAWRQLLFFLSMEEKRVVIEGDEESLATFRLTMENFVAEMQQLVGGASTLSDTRKELLTQKFIDALRMVAVEGQTNSIARIPRPANARGAPFGDVVLGYFNWRMFK